MHLEDLPLTYRAVVQTDHIDLMGHMNVMYYTYFMERATLPLYERFHLGLDYHTNSGFGSFILEDHTRYINEVRLGDEVSIYSRLVDRGSSTIHYINFMRRDRDGALAATTEKIGIHIDLSTRRSAPLPQPALDAYDALLAAHQALDWPAPLGGGMRIRK